jgi:hypothetical protein
MTLMKRKLVARPALVGLVAALATVTASGAVAQSVDGALWLECTETSSTRPGSYAFGFYSIRQGSIIRYDRPGAGHQSPQRWGDYCQGRDATCQIDDDYISASYRNLRCASCRPQEFEEVSLRIDRRTGEASYSRMGGRIENRARAQCRRIEDPRPPAAF